MFILNISDIQNYLLNRLLPYLDLNVLLAWTNNIEHKEF